MASLINRVEADPSTNNIQRYPSSAKIKVVKVIMSEEEKGSGGINLEESQDKVVYKGGDLYQDVELNQDSILQKSRSSDVRSDKLLDNHQDLVKNIRSSSDQGSETNSSPRSTNPSSTTIDLPPHFHSHLDPVKITPIHPLIDIKTPENAWDSLSFIG